MPFPSAAPFSPSRAHILTEWLDPSITDEASPWSRDASLNLYAPARSLPLDPQWVARYRQAQVERNRRITRWVKQELAAVKGGARGKRFETCFVVQGTMADPRWVDPTVEPNGRRPGHCFAGDPETANDAPYAVGRFCTLRGWLSQWSIDDTNADAVTHLARVSCHVLVVECGDDDAVPVSHAKAMFGAVPHAQKDYLHLPRTDHYITDKLAAATACDSVKSWLRRYELCLANG